MQWYKRCLILQFSDGMKNSKVHLQTEVLPRSEYMYRNVTFEKNKDTNFQKRHWGDGVGVEPKQKPKPTSCTLCHIIKEIQMHL